MRVLRAAAAREFMNGECVKALADIDHDVLAISCSPNNCMSFSAEEAIASKRGMNAPGS